MHILGVNFAPALLVFEDNQAAGIRTLYYFSRCGRTNRYAEGSAVIEAVVPAVPTLSGLFIVGEGCAVETVEIILILRRLQTVDGIAMVEEGVEGIAESHRRRGRERGSCRVRTPQKRRWDNNSRCGCWGTSLFLLQKARCQTPVAFRPFLHPALVSIEKPVHHVGTRISEAILPYFGTSLVFLIELFDIAGNLPGCLPRIETGRRFITILRRHHGQNNYRAYRDLVGTWPLYARISCIQQNAYQILGHHHLPESQLLGILRPAGILPPNGFPQGFFCFQTYVMCL